MMNLTFEQGIRYKESRLMVIDGRHIHVPTNPQDEDAFVKCKENEGPHNGFHLNALFDILQKNTLMLLCKSIVYRMKTKQCWK